MHQRLVLRVDPWKGTALVTTEIGLRRTGERAERHGSGGGPATLRLNARVLSLRRILFNGRPCPQYEYDPMGWESAVVREEDNVSPLPDLGKDLSGSQPVPLDILRHPRQVEGALREARGREELTIHLPASEQNRLPDEATLTIVYEITAREHPLAALNFVLPSPSPASNAVPAIVPGTCSLPSTYVQVTGRSLDGMARSWMPCFEADALSSWELEYHVAIDKNGSAAFLNQLQCASSGALCQQFVSTGGAINSVDEREQRKEHDDDDDDASDGNIDNCQSKSRRQNKYDDIGDSETGQGSESQVQFKVFHFKLLDIPTRPAQIGFAIGLFDIVRIPAAPFALAYAPLGMGSRLTLAMEFFSRAFGFINWYLGGAGNADATDGGAGAGGPGSTTNVVAFPYPSYYVTFVRGLLGMVGWTDEDDHLDSTMTNRDDFTSIEDESAPPLANLTLLNVAVLFDSTIIEQNWVTRKLLAEALASQYFGIRLNAAPWLASGISGYLARQLLRLFHGHNEYRYECRKDIERLVAWEQQQHPALADINIVEGLDVHRRWLQLKSILTMIILEHRLERGVLQKILSIIWSEYILQMGTYHGESVVPTSEANANSSLSTGAFLKICKRVSGKDMRSFADQWILTTGCPVFSCSFTFNRRRSTIDVDFKQSTPGRPGKKVIGSLLIRVHEVDGVFDHSVHIDDYAHHFELPVHAKAKKIKKRKRLEITGSGTGMGGTSGGNSGNAMKTPSAGNMSSAGMGAALSASGDHHQHRQHSPHHQHHSFPPPPPLSLSAAPTSPSHQQSTSTTMSSAPTGSATEEDEFVSPLSWIRLDPEMEWIATLELNQPDYMLIEQLHHDRDVVAQAEAIHFLRRINPSTPGIVEALERTLADTKGFHRIRAEAARALALCAPTPDTHLGALKLISFYNKGFALQSSETVVVPVPRPNIFDPLPSYLLLTSLPGALGSVRTRNGTLMELIGQILLNQLRFNDNSLNAHGDGYHVARIINGLVGHLQGRRELGLSTERLSRELLRELDRYAVVERVSPYYRNVVMVAALRAWRELVVGEIISSPSTAITSADSLVREGNYLEVRLAALHYLLSTAGGDDNVGVGTEAIGRGLSMLCSQQPGTRRSCATYLARLSPRRLKRARKMFEESTQLQEILLRGLRCSLVDPLGATSLLALLPRVLESVPDREENITQAGSEAAATGGAPRVALRLVLGTGGGGRGAGSKASEARPSRPQEPAVSTTGTAATRGGEEPDWFYELAGEQPVAMPTTVSGNNIPRLKLSLLSDSLTARLQRVHQSIWDNYDSFPFRAPVDVSVVGYYEVIREPMDLGTMRKRLQSGETASLPTYCADLRRMIDNCLFFNQPDSMISEQARRLRTAALKELKQAFPEYDSRDIKAMLTGASSVISNMSPGSIKKPKKKQANVATATTTVSKASASQSTKKRPRLDQQSQGERMEMVLEKAKEHPYAFWFLAPIDPVALGIPHYPQVIKEPMDLSTIEERLRAGFFQSNSHEFVRLLDLIFTNCTTFNPVNTVVHQNALEMRKAVMRLCKKYLPELVTSAEGDDQGHVSVFGPSTASGPGVVPSTPTPSTNITLKLTSPPPLKSHSHSSVHPHLHRQSHSPISSSPLNAGEDWAGLAKGIIEQLSSHEYAVPFLEPVDPVALGIPTYHEIIKHPMDFGTVRTKLAQGTYTSPAELHRDVTLIFANCYRFNGKNAPISEAARSLQSLYNRLYNEQLKRAERMVDGRTGDNKDRFAS